MALPEEGPLSASQVATEFGVSQTSISFQNLGNYVGIEPGEDPVTLPDSFYGQAGNTPTILTNTPSSITSTGMTLGAYISSVGSSAVTNRGFYFGTNSNYASNTKTQVGSGGGGYTLAKTGLTAGTTYYVTAYAINSQGEARGSTVSQDTTGGTATSGSVMRYGSTDRMSITNRIISPSTEEPTTGIRLTSTSTFTLNFWVKAGWTSALSSQGRHQFLWGVSANAQDSTSTNYTTNVYNNNWRMYYDEAQNRVTFSFLGKTSTGANAYTDNFWWLHKTGTGNAAVQTGLGSTYWSNTNRGDVNDNDFCMITVTYNGSMSQSNLKMYWNGSDIGTAYYASGRVSGTPLIDTTQVRLQALLGTPYGPNGTLTGTGDQTAGYFGGNGNTYIDQYSLWDSALSSTAVSNLYNEGAGGSISTTEQPEGLIVYYNMNSNYQTSSPKSFSPVWPTSNGEFYISGSSDFGSGTNTVDG
jgi:hypothetical protein